MISHFKVYTYAVAYLDEQKQILLRTFFPAENDDDAVVLAHFKAPKKTVTFELGRAQLKPVTSGYLNQVDRDNKSIGSLVGDLNREDALFDDAPERTAPRLYSDQDQTRVPSKATPKAQAA